MKAVSLQSPGNMSLIKCDIPKPQPGWALVRVKAAALCATDIEVASGGIPCHYPLIPGHEWSGIVQEVGSTEDAAWVSKRVVGSNDICCLACPACRSGEWRRCASFREIGFKANGAYAEYLVVPVYALVELPTSITYVQGAMIEPLGVGLGTIRRSGLVLGETITVLGAGSVGLNSIVIAKAAGARKIIAAASSWRRLGFAGMAGASHTVATNEEPLAEKVLSLHPGGSDVVVEATGAMECFGMAISLARKEGRVMLAGYGAGKETTLKPDSIHIPNIQVRGAGNNWNLVQDCVNLLADGLVSTEWMATHTFSLEEYQQALTLTRTRPDGFVKSVFVFS